MLALLSMTKQDRGHPTQDKKVGPCVPENCASPVQYADNYAVFIDELQHRQ